MIYIYTWNVIYHKKKCYIWKLILLWCAAASTTTHTTNLNTRIAFLHASLFSLVVFTICAALKSNWLTMFPDLKSALIHCYYWRRAPLLPMTLPYDGASPKEDPSTCCTTHWRYNTRQLHWFSVTRIMRLLLAFSQKGIFSIHYVIIDVVTESTWSQKTHGWSSRCCSPPLFTALECQQQASATDPCADHIWISAQSWLPTFTMIIWCIYSSSLHGL